MQSNSSTNKVTGRSPRKGSRIVRAASRDELDDASPDGVWIMIDEEPEDDQEESPEE